VTLASILSPSRGVFHLGPLPLRAYALCIILGVVAGVLIGERRLRARGVQPGVAGDIAVWGVPSGIVGARLYRLYATKRGERPLIGVAGAACQCTVRQSSPVLSSSRRR